MENIFITINSESALGLRPYKIGRIVKLTKSDRDIKVSVPFIDAVGQVANSSKTVYKGTQSADRLYDKIGDEAFAQIMFVTNESAIALLLPPEGEMGDDAEIYEVERESFGATYPKKEESDVKLVAFC